MISQRDTDTTPDEFVPDPTVAAEMGVSLMTLWRYDQSDELRELGWPPKISMRKRNFRSRHQLEKFKDAMLKRAMSERRKLAEG
jgi:hypothetical protein